jgi:hypothetical protein
MIYTRHDVVRYMKMVELLHVSWTWAEPNEAFSRDARAEWRSRKGGVIVRWQPCSTLCGMFVQPFSFVSYYFLELNLMISFLIFRRYIIAGWGRDTGIIFQPPPDFDPDLWMEAGLSGGPDRNRVYGLSNTTVENLHVAHSVSTVRSSQSLSSTQSQEFVALQQHTTHLTKKYEWLSMDYEQLRQMIMEMRS